MSESIYKDFYTSRTNSVIPVLQNGKTVESRYNPEREADSFVQKLEQNKDDNCFFIVCGIASGTLIQKITEKFVKSKIIAVEAAEKDIEFLNSIETIKELQKNPNVILCSLKNLNTALIENYIPSLYGNLTILTIPAWAGENHDSIIKIQEEIKKALEIIKADYSVQTHFGKIWQKNILSNLKSSELQNNNIKIDFTKTACIIGAGPSLDETLSQLDKKYDYIIATDTAFSILIRHKITPDIVVSIDGQPVSYNHFLHNKKAFSSIHFLMDLCSNSSAVKKIIQNKNSFSFFTSGHPLAEKANSYNSFLRLFNGSGTVTITALDFAIKAGFKKIKVLGADFSYSKGKAYTKGTYLDILYSKNSCKIKTNELTFDKLLFRTELEVINNSVKTTKVLNSYKDSFENFLTECNCDFSKENNIYLITNKNTSNLKISENKFCYKDFLKNIDEYDLLPFIAWLRTKNPELNFEALCKLARHSLVRYN